MTAATFQTAINVQLNPGIVGEQDKYGPSRVTPRMLDSNGGYIGNYFTVNAQTGAASQGGVIGVSGQVVTVAGGFMIRPKEAVSYGAPGGTPLDPTLFVPGNRSAELLSMGFLGLQTPTRQAQTLAISCPTTPRRALLLRMPPAHPRHPALRKCRMPMLIAAKALALAWLASSSPTNQGANHARSHENPYTHPGDCGSAVCA